MAFLEVFAEDDMVFRYWTGERVADKVQTAFHIRLFSLGLCDAEICLQQKYNLIWIFSRLAVCRTIPFCEVQ